MTAPAQQYTPHRGLVAAAAAFVTFAVLGGAAGLLSEVFESTDTRDSTLTSSVPALTVRSDVGDVVLVPSPDAALHVHTELQHGLQPPAVTEGSGSDGVLLTAACDTDQLGADCSVDYTVQVPRTWTVSVEVGSGQVRARGLAGGVTVDVEQGAVDLRELSGPVDVRSQSGEVRADGLSSPMVTVDSEFGDVSLYLRTPPDAVRVRTDHGSVDIQVPGTTTYRVSADAGQGVEWVGIRNDPSSQHSVVATTDTGHIQIETQPRGPLAVPIPPVPPKPPVPPSPPDPSGG